MIDIPYRMVPEEMEDMVTAAMMEREVGKLVAVGCMADIRRIGR